MRSKVCVWMLLLCAFTLPSLAQRSTAPPPAPPLHTGDPSDPTEDGDEARARLATEMAKRANKERAAALKTDADKLLKLSV